MQQFSLIRSKINMISNLGARLLVAANFDWELQFLHASLACFKFLGACEILLAFEIRSTACRRVPKLLSILIVLLIKLNYCKQTCSQHAKPIRCALNHGKEHNILH